MKICLVGADLFHANEQTNRRTRGMTKLIVAFRSFVNAHKTDHNYPHIRPASYCIIASHLILRHVTNRTGQRRLTE